MIPLSLEETVRQAEAIVVGTVTGQHTRWGDGSRRWMVTDYTFSVEEVVYPQSGYQIAKSVHLTFWGGTLDGETQMISDLRKPVVGERLMVMLRQDWRGPGFTPVVGFNDGLFRVAGEAPGSPAHIYDDGGRVLVLTSGGRVSRLRDTEPSAANSPQVDLTAFKQWLWSNAASIKSGPSELARWTAKLDDPRVIQPVSRKPLPPGTARASSRTVPASRPLAPTKTVSVPGVPELSAPTVRGSAEVATRFDAEPRWQSKGQAHVPIVVNVFPPSFAVSPEDQYQMDKWNYYADVFRVSGEPYPYFFLFGDGKFDLVGWPSSDSLQLIYGASWSPNTLAKTFSRMDSDGWIIEADIALNPAFNWTLDDEWVYEGSTAISFRYTMTHELGHMSGLEHQFNNLSVMNYPPDEYRAFGWPYADDSAGFRVEYNHNIVGRRDLAIYLFYSPGNQYWRQATYPSSVAAGTTLTVNNYHIENVGTATIETPTVEWYLTTERKYSGSTYYFLGSSTYPSLPSFTFFTPSSVQRSFTVPRTVPPGEYYLGAYIRNGGGPRQSSFPFDNNHAFSRNRISVTPTDPVNDVCWGAFSLTAGAPFAMNTTNATAVGDPTPSCGENIAKGVWFAFSPPGDRGEVQVKIDTCGSDFDTVLQVFAGENGNCSPLFRVTCNDDDGPACPGPQASVQFDNIWGPNYRYYILAGGNNGSSGNLNITASFVPANDTCGNALPLTDALTLRRSSQNATSAEDPIPSCAPDASNGVWFSYTAALSGPILISTCGSDFDTILQVYSGACGSLIPVACNDDNGPFCAGAQASVHFDGQSGTNYYIMVAGKNGATGNVAITLHAPSNIALDGFEPDVRGVGGITNGLVLTSAVQSDGRILIGGVFTLVGGLPRTNIARLNPDGSLDLGFNPNVYSEAHPPGYVAELAVQSDGRILVGGDFTRAAGKSRENLARLNPDGTVDGSFNPGVNGPVRILSLQANGTILVGGGFTTLAGQARTNLARLNPNGLLDSTFNPEIYFANSSPSYVGALAVQPDGGILLGGNFTMTGDQSRTNLARLNSDGRLDEGFNPGADGIVRALALQPSGMILVAGDFAYIGGQPRAGLARLFPDGAPDSGFIAGVDGGAKSVATLRLQADGKILLGGDFLQVSGQWRTNLARLTLDGALDSSLNPTAVGPVCNLALQSDGKILVNGNLSALGHFSRNGMGRLYPDGSLDATLGVQSGFASQLVEGLAVQPDGKILVGGTFDRRLARFTPDGLPDTNFNGSADWNVRCLAAQADGKILVGGSFSQLAGQPRAGFGRLDANGSLDASFIPGAAFLEVKCIGIQPDRKILVGGFIGLRRFNPDGGLDATFQADTQAFVGALALQPDGKIVVGGSFSQWGGQPRTNLARLNPDGTADPAFNPGANGMINALALQPDGKILVGGDQLSFLAGHPCTFLARLNADGTFDTSFVGGAEGGNNPQVFSLAVQPDGRILVGGDFTSLSGLPRTNLGRLYPDGRLDEAFDGRLAEWTQVRALSAQLDGDVLVGGSFEALGGSPCFNFGRLNSGGAAFQSLGLMSNNTVAVWSRTGCGPEIANVAFEISSNAIAYTPLGSGTRQGSTWRLAGLNLPVGRDLYLRARGRAAGGIYGGSSSIIESVQHLFLPGPAILTQPTETNAPYGTSVSFGVSAVGALPLHYQWFHGGAAIPDATGTSLELVASDSTAGDYHVVVINPYASVASPRVTLSVRAPIFQLANPATLTIPSSGPTAASSYPSTILVSGVPGSVSHVSVTLSNISHTFPADLDVLLVGPGGQKVLVMSDAGDYLDLTNVTITLDDLATAFLPKSDLILPGTYRPTDYSTNSPPTDRFDPPAPGGPYATNLSAFVGTDPNGSWSLFIMDDEDGDGGTVAGGWSLRLTTLLSTAPAPLQITTRPGGLELNWPLSHIGWRLETQTNAPGRGLGTNWVTVAGSSTTNRVTAPVVPGSGSAFFRLAFP